MRYILNLLFVLMVFRASSQADTDKWVRAFPITGYMVDLNDSVKLVQIELPDDLKIAEKALGLVKGVYVDKHSDTVQKGYGRCQLIKGNYYYFAIGQNKSGTALKEGDLLYTQLEPSPVFNGMVPKLALHFIRLQDVQGENFYDRFDVFRYWTKDNEKMILDSMLKDIRFTGQYFLENDASMNQIIGTGSFQGQYLLQVMKDCKTEWLTAFIDYVLVRPRLYAGRDWKISEIFATWLNAGAPMVIKG